MWGGGGTTRKEEGRQTVLKGTHNVFGGVLTRELDLLAILIMKGGLKTFPFFERWSTQSFTQY